MFGGVKEYQNGVTAIKVIFHADLGYRCCVKEQVKSINVSDCKNKKEVSDKVNDEYAKWIKMLGDFDWRETGEVI